MKTAAVLFLALFLLVDSGFAQDTIQVFSGWNIVGSVKSGAVPDVLATDPPGIITTSFYGYVPGVGYQSTDTLAKGIGYWMKVSTDGIIIFDTAVPPESCSTYLVNYSGTVYTTVQIGSQCWLGENLNVGAMIDSALSAANNGTIEKYCYNNNPANCTAYGGLYLWDEAMEYVTSPGVKGICPPGWHLPTEFEAGTLYNAVNADANSLKAVGQGVGGGVGTDTSGFSALLAGLRGNNGGFNLLGSHAFIWSSTELDIVAASAMHLYPTSSFATFDYTTKDVGSSVRCIRD